MSESVESYKKKLRRQIVFTLFLTLIIAWFAMNLAKTYKNETNKTKDNKPLQEQIANS